MVRMQVLVQSPLHISKKVFCKLAHIVKLYSKTVSCKYMVDEVKYNAMRRSSNEHDKDREPDI